MNEDVKAYLAGLVLGAIGGALIVSAFTESGSSEKVNQHLDAENNVLCYTYRETMQCFLYVDQGTHLEIPEPKLAL